MVCTQLGLLCLFARLNRSVLYDTSSILSHPAPALVKSKIISSIFILKGCDQFNQNFWNFRSKTQWIASVQPKKFRKNGSTFLKKNPNSRSQGLLRFHLHLAKDLLKINFCASFQRDSVFRF